MGTGFCPIWGIWQGAGTPATSQMRCWLLRRHKLHILRFRAKRESSSIPLRLLSKSQSLCWIAILLFSHVGAMLAFAPLPRTLAACLESRTQRRHAPHGAVQALGAPAGSIVPIFFTGGKSARSALFRQMRRSPLLFRNETKMPFCLSVSTLFRIWCEKLFGVQPSLPAGSIFSNNAFAGALISDSFRRSSERRFSI